MGAEAAEDVASTNVATIIDAGKLSKFQVLTLFLCFLVVLVDGLDVFVLTYMAQPLLADLESPPASLGALVSTSSVGMMLCAVLGGILADKLGRRKGILICIFVFGALTLLKGAVTSYGALIALQFLAGCAFGGAIPIVLTLAAEYAPVRHRVLITSFISGAFPVGGVIAGAFVAALLEEIGWRQLFYLSGAVTITIGICLLIWLPESVRFLAVRRAAPERINRIMKRLAPAGVWEGVWWSAPETETERKRSSLIEVFRDGRALSTCLIAAALMATLLSAYFVLAFTPLLLSLSGISLEQSALAGMILLAGGPFGTLLWGWLVGKYWPPLVFAISAAIPAVCFSLVGFSLNTYYLLMILLLFGGIGMASVNAYNGFVASIYPTHIRGTASGLTITLGRIGSVSGPLLGGALVAQGWSIAELYYVPAAWSAVAFVCALLLGATSISRRFIGGARMMARS